jgi:uncharacterized protein (UPF0303 family)
MSVRRDLEAIAAQEVTLPKFTATTAWELGCRLRDKILSDNNIPVIISISMANSEPMPHILFQCATRPGTSPDNEVWVARKRATVLRFGKSTWYMRHKFYEDERAFAEKYRLGPEEVGKYAIHGGGFPVKVEGVEGVVGAIVVSGLPQEQDHQVIAETLAEYVEALQTNVNAA